MRKAMQFIGVFAIVAIVAFGCESVTQSDISESSEVNSMPLEIEGLSSHFATLNAFTQSELDNNWEADREFPTGGVTSVSAFGRDNVAQLSIDSDQAATADDYSNYLFHRTEGIKTVGDQDFGTAVTVDLYLDPAWEENATRAGFWVVGDDGSGTARDGWYGIVEFVNLEPSSSGESVEGDHEGWRVWDSADEWTNLDTDFTYGEWVTLGIELDTDANEYNFYINEELVGSGPAGENFIRELFLNSYNYGLDEFPNLGNDSYAAHWHVGLVEPETKNDCKKGGYADYGFKNQGQCIKFVNTGKK